MARKIKVLLIAALMGLALIGAAVYPVATTAHACCLCPGADC